jgi:hypothetical protein
MVHIHIFKPKIPLWIHFGRPRNGKGWLYSSAIWNLPIMVIRYILLPFGNLGSSKLVYLFSNVLVYCVKKNLATLACMHNEKKASFIFLYRIDENQ